MKNKSAFTLLEVLLAITFITVVFTAITGLILVTLSVNAKNRQTLQGTYLAQEGLEAMRYIRDSNWLQNYAWDEGEDQWGADFSLEFDSEKRFYLLQEGEGLWSLSPVGSHNEDDALVELTNGAQFTRIIVVTPVPDEEDPNQFRDDAVKVTALVSWDGRGNGEVEISTILTNWQ